MTELGPEGRALLRAARGADDDEMLAARERVRGNLGRRLGAAAVAVTTATAATTAHASAATSVGLGLFGKIAIGLASVALVAGGVTIARRTAPPSTPRAAEPSVTIAAPPPVVVVAPPNTIGATPTVIKPIASAPVKVVAPRPSAAPSPIAAEIAALRSANEAIVAGRPSDALAMLDAAKSSGTFGEERAGLRLLARCALDATLARDGAAKFLVAHPSSPLASRLRTSCSLP